MFGWIYILQFDSGHFYIGSTSRYHKRMIRHLSDLKTGNHCNAYMQKVYDKYGKPTTAILEVCTKEFREVKEQSYLDALTKNPKCLNLKRKVERGSEAKKYHFDGFYNPFDDKTIPPGEYEWEALADMMNCGRLTLRDLVFKRISYCGDWVRLDYNWTTIQRFSCFGKVLVHESGKEYALGRNMKYNTEIVGTGLYHLLAGRVKSTAGWRFK